MQRRIPALPIVIATLAAFVLRIWDLNGVQLRWDEGWSIAHAALPLGDILRVTAQDVHPPLYYLVLSLWQSVAGLSPFSARYLSVLAGVLATPAAYICARVLTGQRRAAVYTAIAMACLPLAVYYSAVTRMYAFAPVFLLLAMWGALKLQQPAARLTLLPTRRTVPLRPVLALAIGSAGAMYTLYHSVWALAALALFGAFHAFARLNSRMLRPVALAPARWQALGIGLALLCYLPWLVYGVPRLLGRAANEAASNTNQQLSIGYFLRLGVGDLLMTQPIGDIGVWVVAAVVMGGIVFARMRKHGQWLRIAGLTLSMIALTLIGVAIAARQWAFNARMLIAATPPLALLIGWALSELQTLDWRAANAATGFASASMQVASRRPWFLQHAPALLASAALIGTFWPVATLFVYEKSLEVFDPYSTTAYRAMIVPRAQPNDRVIFNVLSPAGFYASQRRPGDPGWTYALTWDPVREPSADWQARVQQTSRAHDRLWLVLYRGLAGNSNNGDLRGWMDSTFYPAWSAWGEEEVYYGLYGVAQDPLQPAKTAAWGDIVLADARVAGTVRAGGVIPIALTWRLRAPVRRDYKVFVHITRPDGFAIGQHDAGPLNDLRPFSTLSANENVRDNHGVALSAAERGELRVVIGLYDPVTQQRLPSDTGTEAIEIARVRIVP